MAFKKSGASIPDPENPEQLRRRLSLLFTTMAMLALKHTNRPLIQGTTPEHVHKYCAYLLGEHVWEMLGKDQDGNSIATPSWALVLSYERAVRKKAFRLLQDAGNTDNWVTCLERAWNDPLTKERNFVTPLALSSAQAAGSWKRAAEGSWGQSVSKKKDKGKGRGRDTKEQKGKGKGKTKFSGCAAKTPDGRSICFSFNNPGVRCQNRQCAFLHVCGKCFQKHPLYQCKGNKGLPPAAPADTQGGGAGHN